MDKWEAQADFERVHARTAASRTRVVRIPIVPPFNYKGFRYSWVEIIFALFLAVMVWLVLFFPVQASDVASNAAVESDAALGSGPEIAGEGAVEASSAHAGSGAQTLQRFSIYLPMSANDASLNVDSSSQPAPQVTPEPTREQTPKPTPEPTAEPQPTPQNPTQSVCNLSAEEQGVAELMMNHSEQKRAQMVCDPILAEVARARAADMAQRGYFDHVNPDGQGPNHLVTQAGYVLPDWYSQSLSANNIESIGAGYPSAQAVWDAWLVSPGHRRHVLANEDGSTNEFYAAQEAFGIGFWDEPDSQYRRYWVVITAPLPEGD